MNVSNRATDHYTRMRLYKSHGNHDELKKKRRDDEVQLRKQKRMDILENRRRITEIPITIVKQFNSIPVELLENLRCENVTIESSAINHILKKVAEKEWNVLELAESSVLSILSDIICNRNRSESVKEIISRIMQELSNETVNSRSSEEKCLVSLCNLLTEHENSLPIVVDTLQAISVFVGMCVVFRNITFDMVIVPALLNAYSKNEECVKRCVMWLVSQLFYSLQEYSPEVEEVLPLLEIVSAGMQDIDPSIQSDAIRACALMAEWPAIWTEMHENNIFPLLVTALSSGVGVARPSVLSAIDFITQATNDFTQEFLEAGLLEELKPLINIRYLSRDVCFILSNLSAEGEYVIDRLIQSGVLREVVRVMESAEYSTRKEAAFTICHCCASTNRTHISYILEIGLLGAFTDLLTCMDAYLVSYILDAIESLLQYGENNLSPEYTNPVSEKLEEIGCRQKLDFLSQSQNMKIHIKAYAILERFFDDDEISQYACTTDFRDSIDTTIDAILSEGGSKTVKFP